MRRCATCATLRLRAFAEKFVSHVSARPDSGFHFRTRVFIRRIPDIYRIETRLVSNCYLKDSKLTGLKIEARSWKRDALLRIELHVRIQEVRVIVSHFA
jgi:hypothetical protein